MVPEITALYAGLLALWLVFLALRVPKFRKLHRIGVGDGGNNQLTVAIRCHGNASESIPIAVVLLLVAELNGAHMILLHGAGIAVVLGRVLHAWGLTKAQGGTSFGRFWGMILTWIPIIALAWVCIYLAIW